MPDNSSDAEQIKQSGWRQGSILSDDLVTSLVAFDELPKFSEAGRWVVVSHDCDVTNASLSAEPRAELIFGEMICLEKKDGNKEWGKNSRLLQVSDPLENADQGHFQFNAHHRLWIPRQCLIGHRPADQILTLETVHRLAIWLTKRYIRSAFPDEFNERTRPAVTWYNPRSEFSDFVGELVGGGVPDQCCITAGSQLRSRELGIFDGYFGRLVVRPEKRSLSVSRSEEPIRK